MKKLAIILIFFPLWQSFIFSQSADLSLELTVDDNFVDIGQTVTFTVMVTNDGPSMARGVLVMDKLPSGYQFVSANPALGTTYNYASGIWTIGNLGNSETTVLTISAKVRTATDLTNLAEVMASNLRDFDSVPNNGVDTDGDGNVTDDSDDEDDGDGQLVIVGSSTSDSGDCLTPLHVESSMPANPVDMIDGVFKFDYKIEALLDFGAAEIDPEYARGDPNQLVMEYYVNSADGSIMFPGGPVGFFKTNLSYSDRDGTIDAAIWLANGQMVSYVYDAKSDKKHAITRESAQTADGRFGTDYINMMQFFSASAELAENPEPLPSSVLWDGSTEGYKGKLIEGETGIENTWNLYLDTAPTPIRTSCIMMGFMVGVLKDVRVSKCNRLVVFNKVYIGGEGTGDYIQAELRSIRPMGITFNASPYKPLKIGGDYGTPAMEKMEDYNAKLRSIEIRRQTLEREKKRCMNARCVDIKIAALEEIQKEKSQVICEQMMAMGMTDSMAECMRNEGY